MSLCLTIPDCHTVRHSYNSVIDFALFVLFFVFKLF